MREKKLTVSEQMQDELEPIYHWHPTEHDESDDLEMVKTIVEDIEKLKSILKDIEKKLTDNGL